MRDWIFTEKVWICKACRRAVTDDAMPSDMDLNCVCTNADESRNQRRYEIARDVMAGLMSDPSFNPTDIRDTSIWCIKVADALLAELEREDGK